MKSIYFLIAGLLFNLDTYASIELSLNRNEVNSSSISTKGSNVTSIDYTYDNGEWSPFSPDSPRRGMSENDNLIINESVTLTGGFYVCNDVIINNTATVLQLSIGSELMINGILDTGDGLLDASESDIYFLGQSETPTNNHPKNLVVRNLYLNDSELFLDSTYDASVKVEQLVESVGSDNSTITINDQNDYNTFILKDNGITRAQVNPANLEIIGNVSVEEFFESRRAYRFIGSPVDNTNSIYDSWMNSGIDVAGKGVLITGSAGAANGFDVSGSNNPSLFKFDGASGNWDPVDNVNVASPEHGSAYRLLVRGDRSISLTINDTPNRTTISHEGTLLFNDYVIPPSELPEPSRGNSQINYFMISNPYAFDIDISTAFGSNEFSAAEDDLYYIWDPKAGGGGRGAYRTYVNPNQDNGNNGNGNNRNGNNGNGNGNGNSGSNNRGLITGRVNDSDYKPGILKVGQAVFVKRARGASNDNLRLSPSMRLETQVAARTATENITNNQVSIDLELYYTSAYQNGNASTADAVTILMSDQYDNALTGSDARKFANIDETLSRMMPNGERVAVETREMPVDNEVLLLDIFNYRQTDYTFRIAPTGLQNMNALLMDKYTSTAISLDPNVETVYSYMVDLNDPMSSATDRFEIKFENQTLSSDDPNLFAKTISIYPNPADKGVLNINMESKSTQADVYLYNMQGQIIKKDSIESVKTTIDISDLASGIYVAKINSGNQELSEQIIINN